MESALAKCACAALIILSQLYGYHFFALRLKQQPLKRILKVVYILFNLAGFSAFILIQVLKERPPSGFLYDYVLLPGIIWQSAQLISLLPAIALQLIVALFSFFWLKREPKGLPKLFRDKKPSYSLLNPVGLLIIAFLVMGVFSYLAERDTPVINTITLEYPGLPPQLEGFTILLVSDLHYGRGATMDGLKNLINEIVKLSPKLVILAGDISDCSPQNVTDLKDPLLRLKNTPFGVYSVLGDRDLEADSQGTLSQVLTSAGVSQLADKRVLIHGAPLTLIGFSQKKGAQNDLFPLDNLWPIDFLGTEMPLDFAALSGPIPPVDNFTIVVSHIPGKMPEKKDDEIDLYLAGHTRGGQFQVPGKKDLNLAHPFFSHSSGHYREENMDILVTRGVSDSFLHYRLFAWPEVNLITLKRKGPPRPEPGDSFGAPL
ncbi:MAG: metallophosphoesterase [Deltaproteobacteria bacterium]|jgi:predicted MPP superfamily phosphohydrolase|nr:metallophosphoesterase [Deltaproteobacteria bacterium]